MSTERKVRLLIVDDSMLFRTQIEKALRDFPEIEIVGSASDGNAAIEAMISQEIDICTLDIEMPIMNGMQTLKMMKEKGIKTLAIMFSSHSVAGAKKTLEAMELGAVDFVPKPIADDSTLSLTEKIKSLLIPKIQSVIQILRKHELSPYTEIKPKSFFPWESFRPEVLVIASSTGGPNALVEFFEQLRTPLPFPILLTQHMPPIFTASLAEKIGEVTGKTTLEAKNGDMLQANHIYVAPGNFHMSLMGPSANPQIRLDQGEQRNFVRPSADYLFETAAQFFHRNTLGIVLTGMGRDGADGAAAIKKAGGSVLIQNQETCVVFGMPGAVFSAGNFDFSGSPKELATKVLNIAKNGRIGNAA